MFRDRREYVTGNLLESELQNSPFEQFSLWYHDAKTAGNPDPNAMSLATCGADLRPSVRIVLLKEIQNQKFIFFTNYESEKGTQLQQNPAAALCFFWPELERQVRVEGRVSKISRDESEEYFHSRPREAQIGAVASRQSSTLKNRAELEKNYADLEKQLHEKTIPLPENWGGYALSPNHFEFWQGRASRLHDRLCYDLIGDTWKIKRLSP